MEEMKKEPEKAVIAYAKLVKNRPEGRQPAWYSFIVTECPFCGGTHRHAGGELRDPNAPFNEQGYRIAHCSSGYGGVYFVVATGWLKGKDYFE